LQLQPTCKSIGLCTSTTLSSSEAVAQEFFSYSPKGEQLKYVFQILFEVSNNKAEYEVLLHGLRLAVSLGIKRLLVYDGSLLVVQQVNKEWDINKDTMDTYFAEIHKLEKKFSGLEIHHVVRDNNVGQMCSRSWALIEQMSHQEYLYTSYVTHPSRHQIKAPSLRALLSPTERS
jgi:ribonuclease HI